MLIDANPGGQVTIAHLREALTAYGELPFEPRLVRAGRHAAHRPGLAAPAAAGHPGHRHLAPGLPAPQGPGAGTRVAVCNHLRARLQARLPRRGRAWSASSTARSAWPSWPRFDCQDRARLAVAPAAGRLAGTARAIAAQDPAALHARLAATPAALICLAGVAPPPANPARPPSQASAGPPTSNSATPSATPATPSPGQPGTTTPSPAAKTTPTPSASSPAPGCTSSGTAGSTAPPTTPPGTKPSSASPPKRNRWRLDPGLLMTWAAIRAPARRAP